MNTVDVILTATGFLHFSSGRGVVTQESGPRTRPSTVRVRSVRHCRPHVVCAMTQCPRTLRIL
jgi:hypothetical protein